MPPTSVVVPARAESRAASRSGPLTSSLASAVYGSAFSATSTRAPRRSAPKCRGLDALLSRGSTLRCDEMSPVDDRVRQSPLIHWVAVACLSWFVVTVVIEHVLVPELEPARHTISEYANARGAAGALMVAGFLVWAASLATTALLVLRAPIQRHAGVMRALRNVLFALLLGAAVGALVVALFPTQTAAGLLPPGQLESNTQRLHALGSDLIQLCFYPAVLLSLILPSPRWFSIVAVAILVIAVAVAPAVAVLDVDASGARQRVQLAAGCGWQFALLGGLSKRCRGS